VGVDSGDVQAGGVGGFADEVDRIDGLRAYSAHSRVYLNVDRYTFILPLG
jgi:hypothetical protein